MKFCKNCGQSLEDTATFCTQCGTKCEGEQVEQTITQPTYTEQPTFTQQTQVVNKGTGKHNGLTITALIFFAISVAYGIWTFGDGLKVILFGYDLEFLGAIGMISGLVSCIVSAYFANVLGKAVKNNTKLSTAQKVCSLLFGNIISGICLLCDKEH